MAEWDQSPFRLPVGAEHLTLTVELGTGWWHKTGRKAAWLDEKDHTLIKCHFTSPNNEYMYIHVQLTLRVARSLGLL